MLPSISFDDSKLIQSTNREIKMTEQTTGTRHVVIGDIHGELEGFTRILMQAGLINSNNDWIGSNSTLVQTGDVIDRGPDSWECVRLLRKLQMQADDTDGCRVIRLCGNHELMLLEDPYNPYANFNDAEELAFELRSEIRMDKILASYTDGTRLFTHAGLRSEIRAGVEKVAKGNRLGVKDLPRYINAIFRAALDQGDFHSHPIFHIDYMRGGNNKVGGIFWGDYSGISTSLRAYDIPQIFGHTPTGQKGVQQTHNFRLIDIDAGMYSGYGGNLVYLEIEDDVIKQYHENEGEWFKTNLYPADQ